MLFGGYLNPWTSPTTQFHDRHPSDMYSVVILTVLAASALALPIKVSYVN
jgi:hypothetical protein